MFCLETTYPGGSHGGSVSVVVSGASAELVCELEGETRYDYHRPLAAGELARLRKFVAEQKVESLPSVEFGGWDGVEYLYLHLTRDGGRQLLVNNPNDDNEADPYIRLVRFFQQLADPDRLTVRYHVPVPPGLQALFASPLRDVRDLFIDARGVRVQVGTRDRADGQWYTFNVGRHQLGAEVPNPDDPPDLPDELHRRPEPFYLDEPIEPALGKSGLSVRGGRVGSEQAGEGEGTWVCGPRHPPKRLLDDVIHYQVVTPDARWLVGVVNEKLVCFDLRDLYHPAPVAIRDESIAVHYKPVHWNPVWQKVLIGWYPTHAWGEQQPARFRLLDPATGESTDVRMWDFLPRQHLRRPLQPTTRPGVVWAAYPSYGDSFVGRYDLRHYDFLNTFHLPGLHCDSNSVRMDEAGGWVYLISDGHLFRLPLPPEVLTDSVVHTAESDLRKAATRPTEPP